MWLTDGGGGGVGAASLITKVGRGGGRGVGTSSSVITKGLRGRDGPASVSQLHAEHADGRRAADDSVRVAGLLVDAEAGVTRRHEAPEAVSVRRAPADARQPAQSVFEPAAEPASSHHALTRSVT